MKARISSFILFLLLAIPPSLQVPISKKSVTVSLDAKWVSAPMQLEVSEFLGEESSDLFWKFVNEVVLLGPGFLQQRTPKQQYDLSIEIASRLLTPARLALLKFSVALRSYSPTIEMFDQVAVAKQLPEGCESVVEIGNKFACTMEEFEKILNTDINRPKSDTFKIDHQYNVRSPENNRPLAILYAEMGTVSFDQMHRFLVDKSEKKELDYVLRHFVFKHGKRKVRLSGYGVELAIKSTEYKAQDDTEVKEDRSGLEEEGDKHEELEGLLFHRLKELHPEKKEELDKFKMHLLDSSKEMETLKVWELQELSLQAALRILSSSQEEALRVMRDVSQNFPVQAKSLVHLSVPTELKKEMERNQQMFAQYHNIGPTDAALFLNGLYYDADVTDVFTLLEVLKQETRVLEGLHNIGISDDKMKKLMRLDLSEEKQDFAVDIRDSAIQYVNDIEGDKMYRNWPASVQDLLRVAYPGMLRTVRKNIYHLVIIADPSEPDMKDIYKLAESFYIHKAPLRIGLVFAVNPDPKVDGLSDPGVAMMMAYNFISQEKTPFDGLAFITDVYAAVGENPLTTEEVLKLFKSKYSSEDYNLIFGQDSDYDVGRKLAWEFVNRTGIGAPPQVLLNGVTLKKNQLTADMFEEAVLGEIMRLTPFVQKSVYKGDITDSDVILDFLMSQKNVMPRLNKRILTPGAPYIDLTGHVVENVSLADLPFLSANDLSATFEAKLKYLSRAVSGRPVSIWVVADYDSPSGQELAQSSLNFLKTSYDSRLTFIHNPSSEESFFSRLLMAGVQSMSSMDLRSFISKVLKKGNLKALGEGEKKLAEFLPQEIDVAEFEGVVSSLPDFSQGHSIFCRTILKLAPGQKAIVANGRVLGPLPEDEEFAEDDFNLLEKYSSSIFGDKILKVLRPSDEEEEEREDESGRDAISDLMMKTTTVLMANYQKKTRHELKFVADKHSVLTLPPSDPSEPAHDIAVILDPVSRGAQKLSSLLMVLQRVINANVRIFMNCQDKHSNMPLKSFYRFVLDSEPQFDAEEQLGSGPLARFSQMPTSPLLTLGMATPENWMVQSVRTPYDLDNIHLIKVESGIYAEFELEHLLLEGHCFEQSTGNPPRGLQFTLGTATSPTVVDTIVMANLGYFQLKASPGVWLLKLRQGRSADIYNVAGEENTDSPPGSSNTVVAISNFRSHVIKIKVTKKPGQQQEELLYEGNEEAGGIWDSITSSFRGEQKEKEEVDDKINIFSLASGHLYERLLRIMMLSVLKNTKTPVKFWFLKNYLSPTIKDFLPQMAEKYNFEYELVQYKWPRWLNQQTEKQRIIWGYKILFLDVLFPLDVKKIIFVDADQVVRADMKELRDLDLEGAPYGYTPFCESRTDMDGYRFWKSGYWASHLAGRKYHISALYVVDLKKFRRVAAGDRLRGQYQGLSQDPNSLSNLDQDLPNNMIHQVSIKSLPQEWLWCETWCEDGTKKKAKTIDLCNNPKTKESKLRAAMRIIPEWKGYDDEIKLLFEKFQQNKNATREAELAHKHEEL